MNEPDFGDLMGVLGLSGKTKKPEDPKAAFGAAMLALAKKAGEIADKMEKLGNEPAS